MKPLDPNIQEVKLTILVETHMLQKNAQEVETIINQMVKDLSTCLGAEFQSFVASSEISTYPRYQDRRFKRITHFLDTK